MPQAPTTQNSARSFRWVDVEGRQTEPVSAREPQAHQGIDECKRLNRRWRVEVVSVVLVGHGLFK
ncbi:MAG: hypothetical protein DMF90_16860 [Acidobacteria bacterium]|nr:MAG: hypothetical protein DMF90_16860 [Acidobacteriota bacterium]